MILDDTILGSVLGPLFLEALTCMCTLVEQVCVGAGFCIEGLDSYPGAPNSLKYVPLIYFRSQN